MSPYSQAPSLRYRPAAIISNFLRFPNLSSTRPTSDTRHIDAAPTRSAHILSIRRVARSDGEIVEVFVVENVPSAPGFSAWNEVVLPNFRSAMKVGLVN